MIKQEIQAINTVEVELPYECGGCGLLTEAVSTGVGYGSQMFLLFAGTAVEDASEEAQENAEVNADLTLQLTPCPDCGWRDPEAVKTFKRDSALRVGSYAFLASLPLPFFTWLAYQMESWLIGVIAGGFLLVAVVITLLAYHNLVEWKWKTAAGRVRFKDAAKVAREKIPTKRGKLIEQKPVKRGKLIQD